MFFQLECLIYKDLGCAQAGLVLTCWKHMIVFVHAHKRTFVWRDRGLPTWWSLHGVIHISKWTHASSLNKRAKPRIPTELWLTWFSRTTFSACLFSSFKMFVLKRNKFFWIQSQFIGTLGSGSLRVEIRVWRQGGKKSHFCQKVQLTGVASDSGFGL